MRVRVYRVALLVFSALCAVVVGAQGPPQRADAEYLRRAHDSYRAMAQASPYRVVPWQYLGPTNISGRATDVAVAGRAGARRIYVGAARRPPRARPAELRRPATARTPAGRSW